MIVRAIGVTIALSTIFMQPAVAAQPLGDWKIEPSDVRCVAVRQYGPPSKPITLALKASPIEETFQLAILRSGFRASPISTEATLELDGKSMEANALSYPISVDKRRLTHLINLDSDTSKALRSAASLKVTVVEGINETFPLSASDPIWESLRGCVARLQQTWNIGDSANISSWAKGDLRPVFSTHDYPLALILAEKGGSARFALLIDETGRVRDCTAVKPSGLAVLDARSCGIILERGRLTPALDRDGKPTKSYWSQTISWELH